MASPIAAVTPSRTSGVAPLCVTFDATGTTDADTTAPFHDLLYIWNFGDSGDGTWDNGANTAQSKNFATGAVCGHVYETPGTYTWTMVVWDGTTSDVETGTITVTDPDTVFSGTNTVVVSTGTDFTGKPTGADEVTSSDFDAALSANIGAGKRVLFKRGDTFTSSATGNLSAAGAMTVGAWGTGADPIVNSTNVSGVININNTLVDDLRVMDFDIRGSGVSDTGVAINVGATVDNVLLLRNKTSNTGKGISVQSSEVMNGTIIQENEISDFYAASGGNAFFGRLATSAVLGNLLGPAGSTAEHVLRIQRSQKVAVCNNTVLSGGTASEKTNITLRADVHVTTAEDTFYRYVAENKVVGGDKDGGNIVVGPSAGSEDAEIYNVLIERNCVISGPGTGLSTQSAIKMECVNSTVRNNVVDMSLATTTSVSGTIVDQPNGAVAPLPDNVKVINNTYYSTGTNVVRAVWFANTNVAVTNCTAINNLAYLTGGNGSNTALLDQGTGTTKSNNTGDVGTITTDPQFVGPLTSPIGFTISAASYGANGGTASFPAQQSDFFNARDKSGDNRIGAVVQDGEQQIKGVAA